jgi:hypothetical protein
VVKKLSEFLVVLLCLAVFAYGVNYIIRSRSLPPTSPTGVNNAVVITVSDPLKLLVTYPDGRKTGSDPVSDREYHDIPKSKYYFQAPKDRSENGSYWLGLTDNAPSFTLQIIGQTNQYYAFGVYVYRNYVEYNRTFSGRITGGNSASYQIKPGSGADFPLEVSLIR